MGLSASDAKEVERLINRLKDYIDERIESLCGQRIRRLESECDRMSKPAVEALVKTMLGPIEGRLERAERELFEHRVAGGEFVVQIDGARASDADQHGPHIAHVPKLELDRLRRIEEAARFACRYPWSISDDELAVDMEALRGALR